MLPAACLVLPASVSSMILSCRGRRKMAVGGATMSLFPFMLMG